MSTTSQDVVPFLDLRPQFAEVQDDLDKALKEIFASSSFVLGPWVDRFEEQFAKYNGSKFCISVHNGTAAIHLSLLAAGIGEGDEVITTANTFIATAEAISFAGAKPVLVDHDPDTYTMDVSQLEKAVTKRTKAIIPVHLYGQPAEMDDVIAFAEAKGLMVLEDACQSHGSSYKGKMTGTMGKLGCFSFYPAKNLGAAGDGGAIITDDAGLADKLKLLRSHGSRIRYQHEIIGHNYRLDSIQCAVLSTKLTRLDNWNERRRAAANYYRQHLADIDWIKLPVEGKSGVHVYHLYVIQANDRSKLEKEFAASGIQSGIHYQTPVHLQQAYKSLGHSKGDFPVTERACERIVSLPMFPHITREQQDRVIAAIKRAST